MGCNCEKNKSNIFSEEAKQRLIDYIALDKNIIGNMECDEPSDYDKFVMQHDDDILGALTYIEDLEKRWLEEVKINCSNEAKINKLDEKLKCTEYDYNKAMEINQTLVERNKVLSEENHNLKEYIDYKNDQIKNNNTNKADTNNTNKTVNKNDIYEKLFENVTTATITFPQDSKVNIRTRTRYV